MSVLYEHFVWLPICAFSVTRLFRHLRVRRARHLPVVHPNGHVNGSFHGVRSVSNVLPRYVKRNALTQARRRFQALLMRGPGSRCRSGGNGTCRCSFQVFYRRHVPRCLIRRLTRPSTRPLGCVGFKDCRLAAMDGHQIELPDNGLYDVAGRYVDQDRVRDPLSRFVGVIGVALRRRVVCLFQDVAMLVDRSRR